MREGGGLEDVNDASNTTASTAAESESLTPAHDQSSDSVINGLSVAHTSAIAELE